MTKNNNHELQFMMTMMAGLQYNPKTTKIFENYSR